MVVSKVGVLVGLSIIGVASWIRSLSLSETLQGWFPGVSGALQSLSVVSPFLIFVGIYLVFFSLIRRPIAALIITIPISLVLALLLWA